MSSNYARDLLFNIVYPNLDIYRETGRSILVVK